ncbi:hypothetical protein BDM02DRAFT_3110239 [Thelephora ganbajun]|uniref:Uncharacterized protein n=1 Tax=Thelephora ganbajun TaxID=370292 RepID=A0ACB6ZQA5_THEGA|nr:hypothetical protein BDM02DRAFT_3110239 [Thelephora ganbajun]
MQTLRYLLTPCSPISISVSRAISASPSFIPPPTVQFAPTFSLYGQTRGFQRDTDLRLILSSSRHSYPQSLQYCA